jgi:16S rRNA (guanine527-N7)-methyltransferase
MSMASTSMHIGSDPWKKLIVEGAAQLGVAVSPFQAEQMAIHGQEMMAWNRRTNLTAITDPVEVAVKHFLDSLAGIDEIPQQARMLDLGSGGGFPGLPLKVMRPQQSMTLVDGVRKKISFIKHVIRVLQLQHIDARHIRAEELVGELDPQGRFEVVTCRAVGELKSLLPLVRPLVAPDGVVILYKGPQEHPDRSNGEEINSDGSPDDSPWSEFKVTCRDYRLPFFGDARRLIVLRYIPKT